MDQSLKELRKLKGLTQPQAAELLKVSLRSFKTYENEISKVNTFKYRYMFSELNNYIPIDETHGILSRSQIEARCKPVFDEYHISYAYLFGSYANNKATASSDVDIIVSSEVSGLRFYGFVEKIRTVLQKRVDLLDVSQLHENPQLLDEVLRDGIRIYKSTQNSLE